MSPSPPESPASGDLRTALLDAAEIEIGENGAAGASLRAVARRAGVSHQAPGHFFVNRRGLFTALAARYVDRLHRRLLEVATDHADAPALDRLVELGIGYVEFAQANSGLFTLTSSPDQIDAADPELAAARERAWSVLRGAVHDAQQTGWRADQPTQAVAMGCWALVHGSTALWREGWLSAQFPDASLRQLVRAMLESAL